MAHPLDVNIFLCSVNTKNILWHDTIMPLISQFHPLIQFYFFVYYWQYKECGGWYRSKKVTFTAYG